MARVAQGDDAAFEELYDRHSAIAFALALRIVGRWRAEDAVQEGFMSLWRNAAHYRVGRGPVRPWLLGMVRHRSIDSLRRLDVDQRRRLRAQRLEEPRDRLDATVAGALAAEDSRNVRAALAALPQPQREVVELAYFSDWTQTEIAEHLQVPLGTVKGRARLALEKLRVGPTARTYTPTR